MGSTPTLPLAAAGGVARASAAEPSFERALSSLARLFAVSDIPGAPVKAPAPRFCLSYLDNDSSVKPKRPPTAADDLALARVESVVDVCGRRMFPAREEEEDDEDDEDDEEEDRSASPATARAKAAIEAAVARGLGLLDTISPTSVMSSLS